MATQSPPRRKRRQTRFRWTLVHVFVYLTLLCGLLAFGKSLHEQTGADVFWGVVIISVGYGVYYLLPLAAMNASERFTEIPRLRTGLVDSLMGGLALVALFPFLWMSAGEFRHAPAWALLGIGFIAIFLAALWSPILYFWWTWRTDQLSPQLDTLDRLRREKEAVAEEFFRREDL